jgi:FimV-like protein
MTRFQALLTILRVGLHSIMGLGLICLSLSAQAQAQQAPTEHVVQKEESAGQIIQKWLSEGMSTQQMLVALLKDQPDAFIQGNVNLLRAGAVLEAPSPTHTTSAESGIGMLNLNRLLEAPHKNAYLWAAMTLLGVLAVWAGLQIQSRKTSNALSTLTSSDDLRKSASIAPQSTKTALPANIRALNLNLDLNPQARNTLGGVRSTASTETLQ